MAITASGLYLLTVRDAFKNTLALDMTAVTHKWAMFTNSITPNFTTDTAYGVSPYDANEVSGTGYSAGGQAITSLNPTNTATSGTYVYDMDDISWTSSTITSARGALLYADALAGNNAICFLNFGSDFSSSASTFTIQFAAGGVFIIDGTP